MSTYSAAVLATTGLVSYWRLGESVGPTAADAFGSNPGTYTNGPTLAQTGAIAGDSDTGVLFASASTQNVNVTDAASLDLGDTFTAEAWVKRTATQGTFQSIISKGGSAYYLRFNSANALELIQSGIGAIVASTSTITDTTIWHHVVATKTGATSKLYIDSVDVTGVVTNRTCTDNTQPLLIAADQFGENADLYIDEAAVYNVALSSATVLDHYTAGTAAPQFIHPFNAIPFMTGH